MEEIVKIKMLVSVMNIYKILIKKYLAKNTNFHNKK